MNAERYEICYADLSPAVGGEISKVGPAVVVSRTRMNQYPDTAVVCPLTTRLHPRWRSRIQISSAGKDAEIAVDRIRSISKKRLKRRIDTFAPDRASELRSLINEMYGQ